MMLEFHISCGDLNLHWDWIPFGLLEFASRMVQEGCLKIFQCCMHALLDPKLGIANSLPLPSFLKAFPHFFKLLKCGPQFMWFDFFQKCPHILVAPKNGQTNFINWL